MVHNIALDERIQRIYDEHAGRYGYRRICDVLRDEDFSVSLVVATTWPDRQLLGCR